MPYLQMAYTDATGTLHPKAVVVIRSVRLQYEPPNNNQAEVAVSIFHDAASMQAGKVAVEDRPPTALTSQEIDVYVSQFGGVAYGVLSQRREFSGAQVVP